MNYLLTPLIRHRWLCFLFTLAISASGWVAWTRLPIDAFPDVTNVQVMVLTKAPGLSSADIESLISVPIESRLGGLPRVVQVRSTSKNALSQIGIIFEDGTDIYFARQLVFERLQEARESLPSGIEPEMAPITTGLGEIFQYTLSSDRHTPMDLRSFQDWIISPRLRVIPGVTEINSFGGQLKQYQILVKPEALQKFGLSLGEITEAIDRNNANAGGTFIVQGWEQFYVRTLGVFRDPKDIESIVLTTRNGVPIKLGDVAEIVIGHETKFGAVTRDGKGETVAGMVMMLKDANSQAVVNRVKTELDHIRTSLPEGVKIDAFYDRTDLIEACIKTVIDATFQGGFCVIAVLFLFLAEFRTALLVVLSLPITFLVTFLFMGWANITSNLMSLGGLAFSVGMVVDASVVVIENIRRRLVSPNRHSREETVAEGALEVARPVAFSVLIIVIVLVPILFLEGMEGKMFGPLALTMLISLLVSLLVALLIMPPLARIALPHGPETEFYLIRKLHRLYHLTLKLSLNHPAPVLLFTVITLAGAGYGWTLLGAEFMPPLDEGAIAINAVRLPNASLEGAVKTATVMEQRLRTIPEIATIVSKTGRAEISEDPMGPDQTDLLISFHPIPTWRNGQTKETLAEQIRLELAQVPGLRYSFSQPIALRVNELISGIKSDVAVKIFGPDLEKLSSYTTAIAGIVGETPGAVDAKAAQLSGMTQLDISLNRNAAARYGLNVADLNELVETAVGGRKVSTFLEGQQRYSIAVRFPEEHRRDEEALRHLTLKAPDGAIVPLGQVATIQRVETPIEVGRENGMRRLVVECNVRGRDLGGFVTDLQSRLAPFIKTLPTGYYVELGGQFENRVRAMARLSIVVPIALLLIFLLLLAAIGSLRDSVLVLLNLPYALVGGIAALLVFKTTVSVSTAIACIVLLGIAVQNGVILVDFIRRLRHQGKRPETAIRVACMLRFRPLMMTALTSFIGHLPMLFATGSGSDIQKPLAIVVMGGLISSTFLTLVVLPVLYLILENWADKSPARSMDSE